MTDSEEGLHMFNMGPLVFCDMLCSDNHWVIKSHSFIRSILSFLSHSMQTGAFWQRSGAVL